MRNHPIFKHSFIIIGICCLFFALAVAGGCALFRSAADGGAVSTDLSSPEAIAAIFNPARQWAHQHSDLEPDPDVIYKTLPNGFRYILMQNRRPENRVSMHLFIQAGAMHETDAEQGVAHYLEHMLFNGSENFKPGELVAYFQEIGMKFGPDANAHTGFYSTVYDIDLPRGDREGLEKGLLVMRDYAAGALILEEEVERERGIILAEKRTRDSVDYRTFEASFKFELPDALLSRRLPIGTEAVIRQTDRNLLKFFYDRWYRPDRMVLILAGDFDTATAADMIRRDFGKLSARGSDPAYPSPGTVNHRGIKPFYHFEPEAGNTTITIETITAHLTPPDSVKLQQERLLSGMAVHIINNRLSALLEKPDTPFTAAAMSAGHYLNYLKGADITAECPPENWDATLAVLEQTLRQALTHGFTEAETERAKKTFTARLDQSVKAAATRESRQLANQIMHGLNGGQVFQSPIQKQALLLPFVQNATAGSLHQALKNDWAADHRLILITGSADLKAPQQAPDQTPEHRIRQAWEHSSRVAVEKPLETRMSGFPYLSAPERKGRIIHRETFGDIGIVSVLFDNHTQLYIKPTRFKDNQVQASLIFGAGRSGEPETAPGLSLITERVVNLSGLGRLTRDELKQALAGKNTEVRFESAEDCFELSGDSVPDETALLFQLFHAYLVDPGFREDARDLAISQYAQEFDALSHSIDGGMMLKGSRFLAGGDARFGLPDAGVVKGHSLSDIRNWVMPAMTAQPIEVSVVGDLDVETVIDLAATYIGALPDRTGPSPVAARKPVFPKGETLTVRVPTVISKGMVDVAYPTGDFRDNRRNRRLSALSEVISDRMRVKIREEMGAAYSSHAYHDPSRAYEGYGMMHHIVENHPDDSAAIKAAIQSIAADIAANGVGEDELQRAINPILTSIRERVKTNAYWLDSVMKRASRFPAQLDWCRTFETDYAGITAQELAALAKQYLKNATAATVIIVPEPDPKQAGPATAP